MFAWTRSGRQSGGAVHAAIFTAHVCDPWPIQVIVKLRVAGAGTCTAVFIILVIVKRQELVHHFLHKVRSWLWVVVSSVMVATAMVASSITEVDVRVGVGTDTAGES